MSKIISIDEVLEIPLHIPDYQRPYKWTRKNVSALFDDIDVAIADSHRPDYENFTYRVGSVILHKNDGKYDIVDGQQRLITLSMIRHAVDPTYTNALLEGEAFSEDKLNDSESIKNIYDNNRYISERLSMTDDEQMEEYKAAFKKILEVVVLEVNEISEAFQLFDSQNTRGNQLDPHDLLKAYHLREMNDYPFEKSYTVKKWEDIPPYLIRELFSLYLFPILNWSRKEFSKEFTKNDIDAYKGVDDKCGYTYAQRVRKAMPCFQINEPFCAGVEFFKMVEHYIRLISDLKKEIESNEDFKDIKAILECTKYDKDNVLKYNSTGFRYAVNLFYCALLFYYDRFHMLDKMTVKKLFEWAMMIRIVKKHLEMKTINNYAVGNNNGNYENYIPMFFRIATARSDREIAGIKINIDKALKELMGD